MISFYLVGGAVRDIVSGEKPRDIDFLVTGATRQDMLDLGFIPINASSFPVFHHPVSKAEFALARRERKTGPGYHGFEVEYDPTVTVEEDCQRRDLTINAMAIPITVLHPDGSYQANAENIIDPYNGLFDLETGMLRQVSGAFREDPVRVLRVARFKARMPHFSISSSLFDIITEMVNDGELEHLTKERIYLELSKAIMEEQPSYFFTYLKRWKLEHLLGGLNIREISCQLDNRAELTLKEKFALLGLYQASLTDAELKNVFVSLTVPNEIINLTINVRKTERFFNFINYVNSRYPSTIPFNTDTYGRCLKFIEDIKLGTCVSTPTSIINVIQHRWSSFDWGFWSNICVAAGLVRQIKFESLSAEEKQLQGPAIGQAIKALKIKVIQQYLTGMYDRK